MRLPFDRPQTSLFCGLKDKIRNDAVISAMHHTCYSLEGDAKIYPDGLVVNSKNVGGDHISFSEDLISCEDFKADLLLKRYYKSDYEGLFTNDPSPFDLTVQIVSLDCRTIENNIQKVVDLFADK